jgi:hypothetical protein
MTTNTEWVKVRKLTVVAYLNELSPNKLPRRLSGKSMEILFRLNSKTTGKQSTNAYEIFWICSSHSSDYEDFYFPGYNALLIFEGLRGILSHNIEHFLIQHNYSFLQQIRLKARRFKALKSWDVYTLYFIPQSYGLSWTAIVGFVVLDSTEIKFNNCWIYSSNLQSHWIKQYGL